MIVSSSGQNRLPLFPSMAAITLGFLGNGSAHAIPAAGVIRNLIVKRTMVSRIENPVRARKGVSLSQNIDTIHFYSQCVDSRCLGDMTDRTWPGGKFDPFHTLVMVFFSRFFFGLLFLLFS